MGRHFPGGSGAEPWSYATRLGPLRLVVCDTTVPGEDDGSLDSGRLEWLEEELGRERELPTLVAMHHPPIPIGVRALDDIGLPARTESLSAGCWEHPQVVRVLTGHVHTASVGRIGGREVFTCPSTFRARRAEPRRAGPDRVGRGTSRPTHSTYCARTASCPTCGRCASRGARAGGRCSRRRTCGPEPGCRDGSPSRGRVHRSARFRPHPAHERVLDVTGVVDLAVAASWSCHTRRMPPPPAWRTLLVATSFAASTRPSQLPAASPASLALSATKARRAASVVAWKTTARGSTAGGGSGSQKGVATSSRSRNSSLSSGP